MTDFPAEKIRRSFCGPSPGMSFTLQVTAKEVSPDSLDGTGWVASHNSEGRGVCWLSQHLRLGQAHPHPKVAVSADSAGCYLPWQHDSHPHPPSPPPVHSNRQGAVLMEEGQTAAKLALWGRGFWLGSAGLEKALSVYKTAFLSH